jgi:U32 family peptidase
MTTSETHTSGPKPELLAPAGSHDAYLAAVANGADAVYLGLREFNARRGAANFSLDELAEVTRHAHLRGRRIYLTANVLALPGELDGAMDVVESAWGAGVDAVIVQDLGLLRSIRAELPDVRVHASTQLNAHNSSAIAALASLGVSRVTLARETSLEEIAAMRAASSVELESFVHGSLCFCYSGQCLMSSAIGGRSANRGMCAQPCRMPYRLVDPKGEDADTPGAYLLSPKDLAGITVLPRLIASGVSALKVEGRMKSAEYVALVVGVYRAALDRAWADPDDFAITPGEWATLEEAFSRGFTEGSLTGKHGDERMSYRRPNNRGVPVGRVAGLGEGRATVTLDRALDAADTIEVWTGRGRFAQRVGPMQLGGKPALQAPAGARASLGLERPVGAGDRIFRVANASLLDAARRTYNEDRAAVPLSIAVTLRVGAPASLTLSAPGGTATVTGPVVEAARTKRVTPEEVMEHVGRLGGTPYVPDEWSLELDPAAGIGFSTLHALRRDAVAALDEARLAPWSGRAGRTHRAPAERPAGRPSSRPACGLVVATGDLPVAEACLAAGADRCLLAVTAADEPRPLPDGVSALLPRIAHDTELEALLRWAAEGESPVAGELGMLRLLSESGVAAEADWGLNAANAATAAALADLGASSVWASPELSGRQLAALVAASPVPVGVLVAGRLELMVAEHCVLSASANCDRRCATCGRRRRMWTLRDQKGYAFPVTTDAMGRAHLYNAVPLDLSRAVDEILAAGISEVRLDLFGATADEAARVTTAWRDILTDAAAGRPGTDRALFDPATTGHFYRGVR